MLKVLLFSVFLLSSCASASGEWSPWSEKTIRLEERYWRFCSERFDGQEFADKGICFIAQECRERKTILNNIKSECRNKQLFCVWGDIECMMKYKILDKKII